MRPLDYALHRVTRLLVEIRNLKDEDFPYEDSRDALSRIEARVTEQLGSLTSLSSADNEDVIKAACNVSLQQLFKLLPLLGFIIRSTSVRNSFEVFGPLRRLARRVLKAETKLILSSEWDFSPFVYPPISDLPGYVLLGFPASESNNPLLVPLAGHELGHTVWNSYSLEQVYGPAVWKHIVTTVKDRLKDYNNCFERPFNDDLIDQQNLGPAYDWAVRQAEESFCDFLGARLFGTSFLHAFAYLISPGGMIRIASYPTLHTRVENLIKAGEFFSFEPPTAYKAFFLDDVTPNCTDKDRLLLALADNSCASLTSALMKKIDEIAEAASVPTSYDDKINRIKQSFELLTPAADIGDLTNILAAAWDFFYRDDLWTDRKLDDHPVEILKELVLKSIEILEFEERMRDGNDFEG